MFLCVLCDLCGEDFRPQRRNAMPYVELHTRSAFSFLEGASLPESLIARVRNAASLRWPSSIGTASMVRRASTWPLSNTKSKLTSVRKSALPRGELSATGCNSRRLSKSLPPDYHYKITHPQEKHRDSKLAELQDHAEGLICLTGDENGPLAHALAKDGMAGGREIASATYLIFSRENVYVELQRHADRFQESRNQAAI